APVEYALDFAHRLDRGLVRERNEDRCATLEPAHPPLHLERGCLFVVADGMGGHAAGDIAAEIAVKTILDGYFADGWPGAEAKLRAVFAAANSSILRTARDTDRQGMGAAVVAITVIQERAVVAHLGDARGYLVRDGQTHQLTTDHSWVQERLSAGRLSPDEARGHPYRNVLTRAMGADADVDPDVTEHALQPGDVLVLCSDGLWGQADDTEIGAIVRRIGDAATAADQLVDLALARGGPDNVAVVVVRIGNPRGSQVAPTLRMETPVRESESEG
ncbi:MAG: PP2C family serine/threonine-protein phosphatase, partial [Dehalococcoidia bacterium]